MIELGVIRDLVTIFGVIAGFTYYVMVVRNSQRTQQMQLETRQAQLFSQFALNMNSADNLRNYMEVLNWEWEDYHDFEMKYGSDNDTQTRAMRLNMWTGYNHIGKLLREGLLDLDLVYTLMGDSAIWQWVKWRDVIEEQRRRYYTSDFMAEWEYLYSELMRYKQELGFTWEPPATLSKYIPDEQ
ncbi:MAG: hypothetical protein JSV27_08805 [Candidatus Bathyarchaeota archaeon]|nr:MAG: hypothetical protein JSV27_08805 [Candidatus Bathyarchaeota archaeon]